MYEGVLLRNSRVYVLYVQGSRCFNAVKLITPISVPVSFCNPIESEGKGYNTMVPPYNKLCGRYVSIIYTPSSRKTYALVSSSSCTY